MGRHADPDPGPFWRSLGSAVLRGLLGLAIVGGLFIALAAIGQPFGRLPLPLEELQTRPPAGGEPGGNPVVQTPAGTTVWILDGVGEGARAQDAADHLAQLGYEVVGSSVADGFTAPTTVFFTQGAENAARSLARGDERFFRVEANPGFPPRVDLYVLVGDDWPAPTRPGEEGKPRR